MNSTGARILLVDDDPAITTFVQNIIELRSTHRVRAINDPAATMGEIRAGDFELAILDVEMPVIDGVTLLKQIKAHDARIEVVILTGQATYNQAVEASEHGAYEILEKPTKVDRLLRVLGNALEKRRLSLEVERLSAELHRLGGGTAP